MSATRPRGFICNWSPRPETVARIQQIQRVLDKYEDYLPLTLRQVFYRQVAKELIDKTEQGYGRIVETASRARRAGLLNWSAIRDDGFTHNQVGSFSGIDHF